MGEQIKENIEIVMSFNIKENILIQHFGNKFEINSVVTSSPRYLDCRIELHQP